MTTECPTCNAPLVNLTSQNVKICVDDPAHKVDNPLKQGQEPLIKAQR